jgi:hypothetical protein
VPRGLHVRRRLFHASIAVYLVQDIHERCAGADKICPILSTLDGIEIKKVARLSCFVRRLKKVIAKPPCHHVVPSDIEITVSLLAKKLLSNRLELSKFWIFVD